MYRGVKKHYWIVQDGRSLVLCKAVAPAFMLIKMKEQSLINSCFSIIFLSISCDYKVIYGSFKGTVSVSRSFIGLQRSWDKKNTWKDNVYKCSFCCIILWHTEIIISHPEEWMVTDACRGALFTYPHLFSYVFWSYYTLKKKSLWFFLHWGKEWFMQHFSDYQAHPWHGQHSWALDQGGTEEWEPRVDVPRCPRRSDAKCHLQPAVNSNCLPSRGSSKLSFLLFPGSNL